MGLSDQLREAVAAPEWKKTESGYEMKTSMGDAVLSKKGAKWYLSLDDETVELPRRASFDHAEGILKELGAL